VVIGGLCLPVSIKPTSALTDTLNGHINAPATANPGNIIVSPSEVNAIAIGYDGSTFYAVDIANRKLYKSTNGGNTWGTELSGYLTVAGAALPVWNIAVAPDDVNLLVAITDGTGAPSGPKQVFISENGGLSWYNTNFVAAAGEYISCVDISKKYSGNRDIAIGTRTGAGTGRIYVLKKPSAFGWVNQNKPPSDIVALKFSPNYLSDASLAVVFCTSDATYYNIALRDLDAQQMFWLFTDPGVEVGNLICPPFSSPGAGEIVTADLELPSDFIGQIALKRRAYISLDSADFLTCSYPQNNRACVFRVDDSTTYYLTWPSLFTSVRISSIAYWGTCDSGKLLAGEVPGDTSADTVRTWFTSSPTTCPITDWRSATTTGAGGSGWGNAQVAWSPSGDKAYCGTSSANPTIGGTGWAEGQWPRALLNGVALDESAFAISNDDAITWSQLSLIDTLSQQIPDWRRNIQPGDILYEHPTSKDKIINDLATLLSWYDPLLWDIKRREFPDSNISAYVYVSHTGIFVGDDMVIEANPGDGVKPHSIREWDEGYKDNVFLLHVKPRDGVPWDNMIPKVINFAESQVGDRYNFDAWILGTKHYPFFATNWYCSELIWASYYNEGSKPYSINIEKNDGDTDEPEGFKILDWFRDPVFPSEIRYDNDVKEIGRHTLGNMMQTGQWAIVLSPVDIVVQTPDGYIIRKGFTNLPGATYEEADFNNDGKVEDIIYIPTQVIGDYHIAVVPHPGARPTDTYNLFFINVGTDDGIWYAIDTRVRDIPSQGYTIEWDGNTMQLREPSNQQLPSQQAPSLPMPRRIPTPAQMSVQYLSVSPQQTSANQPVTITTNVVNTGGEAGNLNVALKINEQVEQSRMVSVGPHGTQPVKFTVTKAQPGTYTVDIGGQKGSFTILGAGSNTTSTRASGGMIAFLIMAILVLATIVVLVLSFRRPA
jgi:hypothetical protein